MGNPAGDAGLATVLGGLELGAVEDLVMAVSGAPAPLTITGPAPTYAGRPQASESPIVLRAGERLALGQPASGFRSYVDFRGGLDLPRAVSSGPADLLSGTGPAPLTAGTPLPAGSAAGRVVGNPETPVPPLPGITVFHFVPGPRSDWFTQKAAASLHTQLWTSGLPVLFLAGHPVTGSYPVMAVVTAADLDRTAQLAPRSRLRFDPVADAGPVAADG